MIGHDVAPSPGNMHLTRTSDTRRLHHCDALMENLRRASLIRDKPVVVADWHQLNISLRVTRMAFFGGRKLRSRLLSIPF